VPPVLPERRFLAGCETMSDFWSRIALPLALALFCLYALYDVISSPGSLNGWGYLAAAIFLEMLVVVVWDYRRRFFPFLIAVFLLAGMDLPLEGVATTARWVVLAVGAMAGIVIYLRDRGHFFAPFHLVAFFCVVAALVSAMVSSLPRVALLKAGSLLLVFLYGACGARLAVHGREARFFLGLLLGCEFMAYFGAVCYFILHRSVFGNTNSLGAIMGIVVLPVLLWGVLISEAVPASVKRRRTFALVLSILLLLTSYARASIVGATVASLLLCLGVRRYRLLVKGAGIALVGAMLVAALVPVKKEESKSFIAAFLYKGHEDVGIMGSRKTPWEKTVAVIQRHPWFGAGFGTSATSVDPNKVGTFATTAASSREHGNSYLAILDWVGIMGVIPFAALIGMTAFNVGRVIVWLRRTGSPFSPAVPLAAVLVAGLIHATFEDWLFAVGYYICVFFWPMAFMLADVLRSQAAKPVPSRYPESRYPSRPWAGSYGVATPGA